MLKFVVSKNHMKKKVIIIQARLASKRLPQKILLKIGSYSIIDFIIQRCKNCQTTDDIIVATTDMKIDDKLSGYLKAQNIKTFRGSEKNVLERYYFAAKKYDADIIVRVTGDNPLIDYVLLDKLVLFLENNNFDYASGKNYPIGFSSEVFTMKTLEKVYSKASKSYEKEHVTPYIYEHPEFFKIGHLQNDISYNNPMRLTIDTEDDYELIKKVYEYFNYDIYVKSSDVADYLNANPVLLNINKDIKQKSYKESEV